ncbi:MAG TPA: citramalate synthase [Myxococcaceae bacterium]|nr:citramalate synthase [Myxococcaceae bacterium]
MQPEPSSASRPYVALYDTTLRDGTQREGISLSCEDKLRIARRLDELGVSFIEGGWPGSNPKDAEFFTRARDMDWRTSRIAAFGATRRIDLGAEDDPGLKALLDAGTEVVTIFGKTSPLHVREVLRTTLETNLEVIRESVAFLRSAGRRVIYDAEHFFDGRREDREYALETLRAAIRGGAEVVVVCDTNGGSLPWEIAGAVADVRGLAHPFGVHTHNDSECAVANALEAVRGGASHVQGTINGYGERCGNANLCALIPDLELKLGVQCLPDGALRRLSEIAHFVAEVANLSPDEHMAYVGRSAFAHKGGVHVHAMRRNPRSYQHVDPEVVGNESRIVVSELSGKATVVGKAEELGLSLGGGAEARILARIKDGESRGLAYEAAEASVALLVKRDDPEYHPPFEVLGYKVIVSDAPAGPVSEAVVKLRVDERVIHTAAEGNGPVSALDAALRKALAPVYPATERICLVDYKVRIIDGENGTGAAVRVLIDSSDGGRRRWSTVGASRNIIAASCEALTDSFEYGVAVLNREAAEQAYVEVA